MLTKICAIIVFIMAVIISFKGKRGMEDIRIAVLLYILGWLMLIYAELSDIKELLL